MYNWMQNLLDCFNSKVGIWTQRQQEYLSAVLSLDLVSIRRKQHVRRYQISGRNSDEWKTGGAQADLTNKKRKGAKDFQYQRMDQILGLYFLLYTGIRRNGVGGLFKVSICSTLKLCSVSFSSTCLSFSFCMPELEHVFIIYD